MIGALVSYEAERLTVGKLVHQIKNQDKKNTGYFAEGSRRYPVARLRFNVSNGEVRGMSCLHCFILQRNFLICIYRLSH